MNNKDDFSHTSNDLPKETEDLIEEAESSLKQKDEKNLLNDDNFKKEFLDLKKSAEQIHTKINKQTSSISNSINIKNQEIKKLNNEKILFDRDKIQLDIFENQKLLINDYKEKNQKLELECNELEKKLKDISEKEKRLSINNIELKNTISRYINHNKNLQKNIDLLKIEQSESMSDKSQIEELKNQIKFYQENNVRISSELINVQKKYEIIKNNFDKLETEKHDIYKQIQELNNSLINSNIVGTPYHREKISEDSVNSKVLNDISEANLQKEKEITNKNIDLDKEINDIFK